MSGLSQMNMNVNQPWADYFPGAVVFFVIAWYSPAQPDFGNRAAFKPKIPDAINPARRVNNSSIS